MAWGVVVEGGVGAFGVIVLDVSGDRRASGGEVVKAVLPGAFLFEGADEPTEGRQAADRQGRRPSEANQPLAQPVLLGCVGRDIFLREAVVAHEGAVGS